PPMSPPHTVWKYFKKGRNNYKENATHKEAWCNFCIDADVSLIHTGELDAEQQSEDARRARDEETIRECIPEFGAVYTSLTALCGKVDSLLAHLSKRCLHVPSEKKDWAKRALHERLRRTGTNSSVADEQLSGAMSSTEQSWPPRAASWPQWYQNEFAADLCKLFIVANIAWYALEIPFFRYFFTKYMGQANLPGRKELSGHILDEEADKVTKHMQSDVKGRYVTGQCDGWKNISKDHIIATIINAEYMTYLINTFCITKERKNAENLLEIVLDQIRYYTDVLKVMVVAWCSDASGDGSKMRRLLVRQMPWIFVVDCWAHQINLVTGDVFKHAANVFEGVLNIALEVTKWFNNHTRALGMLKDSMVQKLGKAICLILPVITRWTSHYLVVQRLIDVELAFRHLLVDHEEDLLLCAGDKEEAKQKALDIIGKVKNYTFFTKLKRLSDHLRPLAIATNLFQSDDVRLDIVLITLAKLYHIFSDPHLELSVRRAVLSSLEK
ncbi:hypothetical protein DAEQUDRAFT_678347, partial [Daedalea quercina L-15889]